MFYLELPQSEAHLQCTEISMHVTGCTIYGLNCRHVTGLLIPLVFIHVATL